MTVPIHQLAGSAAGASWPASNASRTNESDRFAPPGPMPPNLLPMVHCLEYSHPTFREPQNGEWVIGLYRDDDGSAAPLLLWADTRQDRFWDAARRQHVKPPKFYLRLSEQPQIDRETGYPIIDGAVCPF